MTLRKPKSRHIALNDLSMELQHATGAPPPLSSGGWRNRPGCGTYSSLRYERDMSETDRDAREALDRLLARRRFLERAVAGTVIVAFGGGAWLLRDDLTREAQAQTRPDGRPRLPAGQRVISALKPMGGDEGDASPGKFRLKVHGEVEAPFEIGFADLLKMPRVELALDVHCVTGWSVLGAKFEGVRIAELAQ